ncbi:hypothetical protein BH09VER1_BH09VER1_17550 [soil metagenome]
MKARHASLFGAAALLLATSLAQAANMSWLNAGTDFNTASNWNTTTPGTGDVALFNTAASVQPNLSSSLTIQELSFNSVAIGYNLTSSSTTVTLTLTNVGTGAAGAISAVSTTGSNVISGPLILGAAAGSSQAFTQSSGGLLALTGVIASTNSVNLSLAGGGIIALGGANTYTGTTTQAATGTILVNNKAAFSNTVLNLAGGGKIQAGTSLTGANKITNNIVMAGNETILDSPGFGVEFGGTVNLGGAGRTITSSNTAGTTFSGLISNDAAGGLIVTTTNSLVTFTAANSYTGVTTIQGSGTVSVSSIGNASANGNLGAGGSIKLGSGANSGNLVYTGAGETTTKSFNLGGTTGNATIDQSGAGLLKFTSGSATGSGNKVLTLQGSTAGTGEISGSILNGGSGTTSLVKAGTGSWTLSGNNGYTGSTTVSAGTLIVSSSGTLASSGISVGASGTFIYNNNTASYGHDITVDGRLGGSGKINGTISGAGVVGPGNSAGILTANAVTASSGLDFAFEFSATGSPTYGNNTNSGNDVLRLTGATPFTASLTSGNQVSVYLQSIAASNVYVGGFYADSGDFASSVANATYQYFVFNGTTYDLYAGPLSVNVATIQQNADFGGGTVNGYVTQFTVVPEPATCSLIGAGLALVLWRARSRRRAV